MGCTVTIKKALADKGLRAAYVGPKTDFNRTAKIGD